MNKIQSVNLEKITDKILNELTNWQKVLWAWWIKYLKLIKLNLSHWYDAYIMLRFLTYKQEFWLISEQIEQLKISSELTLNKQEFLLKILMQQEEYLIWNMSEFSQIHFEVVSAENSNNITWSLTDF